jgi:hypothetical protein
MSENMMSAQVVLISAAGAVVGMELNKLNISTGNRYLDFAIGVGLAVVGYVTDYDGISDFVEGMGIGYAFAAIL